MVLKKESVVSALLKTRETAKKRNFTQSVDLNMVFKGLDLKKPEGKIEVQVKMPFASGKQGTSKALVFIQDKDLAFKLKERSHKVIMIDEIPKISKQEAEKLMSEYDAFFAEGPAMLIVAKHLGQQLAPKGRMPRLLSPTVSAFENEVKNASSVVKVSNKKGKPMPLIHVSVGKESDENEKLAENVLAVYNAVLAALPGKEQNISSVYLKLTMSSPVKLSDKPEGAEKEASK